MIVIGFIGEDEELIKRKYEDPYAVPAPQAPDAEPVTAPSVPAPTPAAPVPA